MVYHSIRLIMRMFTHTDSLTHNLAAAESQAKGLLILKDRPLVAAGLRDLIASLLRVESGAAAAAAEADSALRELENGDDESNDGRNGI